MNKNSITIEFEIEDSTSTLTTSDNFRTEESTFLDFAYYLGAIDHNLSADDNSSHLTTLEKLEILCKKAREYADQENLSSVKYAEVKITGINERKFLSHYQVPIYDSIELLTEDLIKIKIGNLYGLVNNEGKELVEVKYKDLHLLTDSFILLESSIKKEIISSSGKVVFTNLQEVVENFNPFGVGKNYFWLRKNYKWGLFDDQLKEIITFSLEYDHCELVTDNHHENIYIKVFKDEKVGLLNGLLNIEVIPLAEDIDDITEIKEKTFLVTKVDSRTIKYSLDQLLQIESSLQKLK